jgi:hypothetical protein
MLTDLNHCKNALTSNGKLPLIGKKYETPLFQAKLAATKTKTIAHISI